MSGLSEELKAQRLKSAVTASELHHIMGGWRDKIEEPSRSFVGFEDLEKHIKPLYEKGQRKFNVTDVNPLFDFKVMKKDIDATLNVIKWDQTGGVHPPCITHAHHRVRKELFDDPEYESVDTYAMRIGRDREPDAIDVLGYRTGLNWKHTEDDQIHRSRENVGSTPDAIAYNDLDLMEAGAEVKGFAPTHHLDCWSLDNQKQLEETQFEIFCQAQAGLFVFQLDQWFVGFYNPNTEVADLRFRYVKVQPDQEFFKVMLERVEMTRKAMDERRQEIWDKITTRRENKKAAA